MCWSTWQIKRYLRMVKYPCGMGVPKRINMWDSDKPHCRHTLQQKRCNKKKNSQTCVFFAYSSWESVFISAASIFHCHKTPSSLFFNVNSIPVILQYLQELNHQIIMLQNPPPLIEFLKFLTHQCVDNF